MSAHPEWDSVARPVDEHMSLRPHPALRGAVAGYSAYRQRGVAPMVHRGLPSPYLTLIFTFEVPLHVAAHPDPRQPGCSYRSLVGGLHTTPALITHQGEQAGIQVSLSPLGARALLGLPAGELAATDLPGGELLGPWADEVCDRLEAAASWRERAAAVDAVLLRALGRDATRPAEQVCRAWHLVVGSGGNLHVGDLARDVGWSTRHLQTQFRAETGLTPKEALRVTRFDRTRRRLRPSSALAPAAVAGGYYDQAHLAREFRDLAGCSPSQWLATEFANVQATAQRAPPNWGHDE
ncbi:MAG: helix-turn-helix domain-containing protein [Dermatophilaceae bacterium]